MSEHGEGPADGTSPELLRLDKIGVQHLDLKCLFMYTV